MFRWEHLLFCVQKIIAPFIRSFKSYLWINPLGLSLI